MKLAYIDCLPVGGGLSRFSLGLCRNILKHDVALEIDYYIHFDNYSKMKELSGLSRLNVIVLRSTVPRNKYLLGLMNKISAILNISFANRVEKEILQHVDTSYDLAFFPHAHMMPFLELPIPIVSTFHDFNWNYFFGSRIFSDSFYRKMREEIPKWLAHTKVITLSDSTLQECRKLFPNSANYPEVIPVSALTVHTEMSKEKARQILDDQHINYPYILYPANLFPHKNHLNLFTAFSILKQGNRYTNYKLILTGGGTDEIPYGKAEYRGVLKIDSDKIHQESFDIIGLGYVSNEFMDALIIQTELLISVSIYEEMCQPAMDAWKFGTPTALSDIPAFREHEKKLGVKSVYFDPMDPNDIAQKIAYCLDDTQNMEANAKISFEKMDQYNWDVASSKFLKVFYEAN